MNYHLRSDRKFRKTWLVPVIIIAIILLLIISSPLQRALGGTLNYLGYPFWRAKAAFSNRVSRVETLWRSRLSLVEDNKALKGELTRLKLDLQTLPFLKEENKNLKALLDRGALHENLPALVLARPPQTFYDVLIIDAGKNSGLEGGEIVYFESIVLGEVEEVNAKTSKVRLYSSSNVETETFLERIDLPVLVTGRGGGNFEARLPQESPIEEGDFLTIVGNPNRLLGQVESIEANPTDSFKKIILRYPVNLSEIQWLAVEIKSSEN